MPANPRQREVFKVLDLDGNIAPPGHPYVILFASEEAAVFSNITDVDKEDDPACVLLPEDDPNILTKRSTFRYQDIKEQPVAALARAFENNKLMRCGQISRLAFQKILNGAASSRRIKPRYRALLHGEFGK